MERARVDLKKYLPFNVAMERARADLKKYLPFNVAMERARADLKKYLPFNVAMERARADLKKYLPFNVAMERARADLKKYLPFNVAMERARADLKPREQRPATPKSNAVDGCWSRDRVSVAAASLRSGSGPPLSYASVTARRGGRMGRGTGRGPVPRSTNKTNPKPASVSAPGAKKNRTALAVANLFASLADVTGGAPTGRPVSPLPEAGTDTAPTKSAGCSGTLGTNAVEEAMHSPKAKRRRVRKQKTGKAGLKTASLRYQLLLEQRKTKILEKKLQEITPAPQREDLRTELNELFDTAGVEPQPQQGAGESQSLDVSVEADDQPSADETDGGP